MLRTSALSDSAVFELKSAKWMASRRFTIGPGTWSLRSNMEAAIHEATQVKIDLEQVQELSKVKADQQAEDGVCAILAWTRQIRSAPIPADIKPIVTPLDYWGYTLRLTEDDDLEGESTCDDILTAAPTREGRWFRLPRSVSEP